MVILIKIACKDKVIRMHVRMLECKDCIKKMHVCMQY